MGNSNSLWRKTSVLASLGFVLVLSGCLSTNISGDNYGVPFRGEVAVSVNMDQNCAGTKAAADEAREQVNSIWEVEGTTSEKSCTEWEKAVAVLNIAADECLTACHNHPCPPKALTPSRCR